MVIIDGEPPPGELVPVRISGAMAYDLSGVVDTSRNVILIEGLGETAGL